MLFRVENQEIILYNSCTKEEKKMNNRLKIIRQESGLSQAKFGENIGMTRDEIANIEQGRAKIKQVKIKLICDCYNVNERWLLEGIGEMKKETSREKDIAEIVSSIYKEDDMFKFGLIKIISEMNQDDLLDFRNFVKNLYEKYLQKE